MSNKNLPPQEIKYSKLKHLETKYYRSETGILFCMWRPVIIVLTSATKGDTEMQNKPSKITKPNVINDYNNAMNGCDENDQIVSHYNSFYKKTIKWWKECLHGVSRLVM